jgi:hypothetical protein
MAYNIMAQYNRLVRRGITLGLMALLILACGLLPSKTTGPGAPEPTSSVEEEATPTGQPVLILPGTWYGQGACTIEGTTFPPGSWDGTVGFDVSEGGTEITNLEIHCTLGRDFGLCHRSAPWEPLPDPDCNKIVSYKADFSAAPLAITDRILKFTDEENEMTVAWLFSPDGTSVNVTWVVEYYASGQSLIER